VAASRLFKRALPSIAALVQFFLTNRKTVDFKWTPRRWVLAFPSVDQRRDQSRTVTRTSTGRAFGSPRSAAKFAFKLNKLYANHTEFGDRA
jgi:hypothetical protein